MHLGTKHGRFLHACAGLCAALATAGAAEPTTYDLEALTPPTGTVSSGVLRIAHNGQTVNWATTASRTLIWSRSASGAITVLKEYPILIAVNPAEDEPNICGSINDNGDTFFSAGDDENFRQAFYKPADGPIVVVLGFDITAAGINNRGYVALCKGDPTGQNIRPAFVGLPSNPIGVGFIGPNNATREVRLYDLNSQNAAVGLTAWHNQSGAGEMKAVRALNGQLAQLPTPVGYFAAVAEGISDSGAIVGRAARQNSAAPGGVEWRAVVWIGNTSQVVEPFSTQTPAGYGAVRAVRTWDINDSDQAVGVIRHVGMGEQSVNTNTDLSQARGFVIENGVMKDLNANLAEASDWRIIAANGITNTGLIAATATRGGGTAQYAVLLRPRVQSGGGGGGGGEEALIAAPLLDPASDLGTSATDRLTSAKDLVFTGAAPAGATVRLVVDDVQTNRTAKVAKNGAYSLKLANAPSGRHEYRVIVTPKGEPPSAPSGLVAVTKDATLPVAPAAPSLAAEDLIATQRQGEIATRNLRPTITGTATAGNTVRLLNGGKVVGQVVAGDSGGFSVQPNAPLKAGSTVTLTVVQIKPSGAISAKSKSLKIKVLK